VRRKKFNFPLFIILWISHRVTNLTHAVYFWWTVASIILPVFLHIQIVQAFVCQLSSLYRIAPSSSPQLSSFMSLFNGSRLKTYCPVACPSLWTVWTQRTLWLVYELHSGVGLRIHFSGYRGQYTQTGRSMNQADHPQILLFEIGRIHRFVVYKVSIHKYSQLGNSHHPSIVPLKVCCKFNIIIKIKDSIQMKFRSKWAYGFSWTWPWIRRTNFFLFLYFLTLNMVTTKATFMKMNSTFFVVFVFKRIYTCFLKRFSIYIDSTVCEHCIKMMNCQH